MDNFKKRIIAGRIYSSDLAIPIPRKQKTAIITLNSDTSYLGNLLKSNLLRMIAPRVGYAPRRISLETYSNPRENWGLDQLKAYRKEKLISRISLSEKQALEDTVVFNLGTSVDLSNSVRKDKVSPQKYYEDEFNAIINNLPDMSGFDNILLFASPTGNGQKRLQSISLMQNFLDVFISKLYEKDSVLISKLDPKKTQLILTDQNVKYICRFDINDKRLSEFNKMNSLYASLERYLSGLGVDSEEDTKSLGIGSDNSVKGASETLSAKSKEFAKTKFNEFNISSDEDKQELLQRISEIESEVPLAQLEDALKNDDVIKSILTNANKPSSVQQTKEEKILDIVKDKFENATYTDQSGNTVSINELSSDSSDIPIKSKPLNIEFLNKHMKENRASKVTESYYEEGFYKKDLVNVFKSLASDSETPLYVNSVEITDASDSLSLKDNLRIQFRDEDNKSQTVNIEIPRMTNDGYFYVNGSKWGITKQIIALPIIKVKPDQVLITTAYNKATVERFGQNVSKVSGSIKDLISEALKAEANNRSINIKVGSTAKENETFDNDLQFEDIAKLYTHFIFGSTEIYFGRQTLEDKLSEVASKKQLTVIDDLTIDESTGHPIGIINGDNVKILTINSKSEVFAIDTTGKSENLGIFNEFILNELNANKLIKNEEYTLNTSGSKKYIYSRIKLLSKQLPLILILGFSYGLVNILNRYNVNYKVLDPETYRSMTRLEKINKEFIKFKDAYLMYDTTTLRDALLLNGLQKIPTNEYKFEEYQKNGKGWIDYIADIAGSVGYVKGLVNFRESLIDPISAEILESMGITPDFAGIMLEANTLLDNNSFKEASNMENYRIRSHEMLNGLLYKVIHREMEKVRATKESAIPQKLSIPPKAFITDFITASNVEEMQLLNPLIESEMRSKVTWTGFGGLGDDTMLTKSMRAFHPTMKGVFGYYTPDSSKVGAVRALSYNTQINTVRGYMGKYTDNGSTNATKLLTLNELLNPFASRHSDPPK